LKDRHRILLAAAARSRSCSRSAGAWRWDTSSASSTATVRSTSDATRDLLGGRVWERRPQGRYFSCLTSMVQVADLFGRIYRRFGRTTSGWLVGLRHHTGRTRCTCKVCADHGR